MKSLFLRASFLVVLVLAASSASADVITEWWEISLQAVRDDNTCPPVAARTFGIMGAAVFDAVNAIDRTYIPYKVATQPVWGEASKEAATIAASYTVLTAIYTNQNFDTQYNTSLATIPEGSAKVKGIELGTSVAN
jgi:hypothetical protein